MYESQTGQMAGNELFTSHPSTANEKYPLGEAGVRAGLG